MFTRLKLILAIPLILQTNIVLAQDIEESSKEKPFAISGNIDLRGIGYAASGIPDRRKPFSYFLNGNTDIRLYGISIPFSVTISEQDRQIRQPFNQYGLSPNYKWATLHLGYRNITFSPYTLAGYTMLGAGLELTPGKLRFGFMYGRLNRATNIDTATGVLRPYSFSRKGYAVKLGYGKDEKMIELSYLTAKDDSTSVKSSIPDSLRTVTPAANAVFSIRVVYTFAKKLFVEADAGASLYTYNTGSTLGAGAELEKVNSYTKNIVIVNASSQANIAYTGAIGYKEKNWSVKLSYRHIDPEFQSMGAYFFNSDVESYSIAPAFSILKNKIRFNGSIGLQYDNLRKQKTATTQRVIGSANLAYDITDKLGLDASYINFSTNAAPTVVNVNNKYLLAQTTHNVSVTPRYVLANEKHVHVILLSYNYSSLVDANADTKLYNTITTGILFLTYSITINKSGLTVTAGLNSSRNKFYTGNIRNNGITLGVSKNFLKDKLQLSTTESYTLTNQFGGGSVLNAGLNASYTVTKHHKFSLRYSMLINNSKVSTASNQSFTEHTAEAGYLFTF